MLDKPILFSESPLIEQRKNVGWKREAHSFFNPERLCVAWARYYKRRMKMAKLLSFPHPQTSYIFKAKYIFINVLLDGVVLIQKESMELFVSEDKPVLTRLLLEIFF